MLPAAEWHFMNYYAIIGILSIAGGFFVGYFTRKSRGLAKISNAESRAEKILSETKAKQKELILEAQEKSLKIIEQAKKEEELRRRDINSLQSRLEKEKPCFLKNCWNCRTNSSSFTTR